MYFGTHREREKHRIFDDLERNCVPYTDATRVKGRRERGVKRDERVRWRSVKVNTVSTYVR